MTDFHVLVVDGGSGSIAGLADIGRVTSADSVAGACRCLSRDAADVVLLDLSVADCRGFGGLTTLAIEHPDVAVVALCGGDDAGRGADAVRAGAQDYLLREESEPRLLERVLRHAVERKGLERRLESLTRHDPLTDVYNRRHFFERAAEEFARARRYAKPLSLVMIDLDRLRDVNEAEGHAAGDSALRRAAEACRGVVRDVDVVARLGGEEFAVLLPETDSDGAMVLAERIRAAIADAAGVTASLGIASGEGEGTPDALLQCAEAGLAAAKRAGGDSVRTGGLAGALPV